MTCEDVNNVAAEYLGGELSTALRAEVDAHLADCSACRGELAGLATASHALRAATVSPTEAERRVVSLELPEFAGNDRRAEPAAANSEAGSPGRGAPSRSAVWWVAPLRYAAVISLAFAAGFLSRGAAPAADRPETRTVRIERPAAPAGVSDVLVKQFREASSDFPHTSSFGRSLLALARRQG